MDFFKNNKKLVNLLAVLLVVGLFVSLIPLLISSFYARPLYDDFGYSAFVRQAVKDGEGFKGILAAVFRMVRQNYYIWQGTYSAIGLFSIQPAAFSDNLYFLTTFVILTGLIASTFFFVLTAFRVFGYEKKYGVICSCILLLLSIHFVINKHEAFFWWNGSSYYTLFYAFSLVYFALLLRLYFAEKAGTRIACFMLALFLVAMIGGGNYSTALVTTVLTVLAIPAVFRTKKKLLVFFLPVLAMLTAGFAVSITAPGNSVRAATVTVMSPIKAVVLSILYAAKNIAEWTGVVQLAGFAIVAVIAFYLTRNSRYQFRFPLLFAAFSFLIFAAQLTPPLYAMGIIGFGRQINMYYYSYYLLVSINLFYLCGWINRKQVFTFEAKKPKAAIVVTVCAAVCFMISGCLNYGIRSITFVDTLLELKRGTPQAYSAEFDRIMADIENGATQVDDVKTCPDFFAPLSLGEDPDHWTNKHLSQYFGIDQITLKPTE